MDIYSHIIEAQTTEAVKRIEKKYLNLLPDCQKPKLQQICRKAIERIERNDVGIKLCKCYCNN